MPTSSSGQFELLAWPIQTTPRGTQSEWIQTETTKTFKYELRAIFYDRIVMYVFTCFHFLRNKMNCINPEKSVNARNIDRGMNYNFSFSIQHAAFDDKMLSKIVIDDAWLQ